MHSANSLQAYACKDFECIVHIFYQISAFNTRPNFCCNIGQYFCIFQCCELIGQYSCIFQCCELISQYSFIFQCCELIGQYSFPIFLYFSAVGWEEARQQCLLQEKRIASYPLTGLYICPTRIFLPHPLFSKIIFLPQSTVKISPFPPFFQLFPLRFTFFLSKSSYLSQPTNSSYFFLFFFGGGEQNEKYTVYSPDKLSIKN